MVFVGAGGDEVRGELVQCAVVEGVLEGGGDGGNDFVRVDGGAVGVKASVSEGQGRVEVGAVGCCPGKHGLDLGGVGVEV